MARKALLSLFIFMTLVAPARAEEVQLSQIGIIFGKPKPLRNRIIRSSYHYLMAPIYLPTALVNQIREEGAWSGTKDTVTGEGKYLIGYAILSYGAHRFLTTYATIDQERFDRISEARMNRVPKKVLGINLMDDQSALKGFAEGDFLRKYGSHPDTRLITATTMDSLISQLKALPQDHSFDRIEIYGHGAPGLIAIGKKGGLLEEPQIQMLKDAQLDLSAPDADLRFMSCSVAHNPRIGKSGEKYLKNFGRAFLRRGGQLFGSTRDINVGVKATASWIPFAKGALQATGLELTAKLTMEIMPTLILKDLAHARNDVIEVRVPSAPEFAGRCARTFSDVFRYREH